MPLRGSVSSSLAQTGSFGRMQGRRLATQFLNVQSGSFGRVIATNFAGDGSQLTNVASPFTAAGISGSFQGATSLTASFGQMILNDATSLKIQHPTANTSVFIGHDAGVDDDGGNNNVAIGNDSMGEITSGQFNIALGHDSLHTETTGDYNVAIGDSAMSLASNADHNVAIGNNAVKNITGFDNVGIGKYALMDHQDGDYNVAIGSQAMGDAGQDGKTLDHMVAIGTSTLQQLESGYHNIAIGRESQRAIVTGSNNITIGYRTLFQENDAIGSSNIVIGSNAGYNANGSSFHANVIIGDNAGYQATNRENVLIGEYAGNDLEGGSQNVVIGANAARFSNTFQSNTNSVLIGHRTEASADGNTNENVFGYNATGKGSNTVTLGNASVTDIYLSQDKGAIVYAGTFSGSAAGLTDIPAAAPTFTDIIIQTGVGGSDNTIIGDSNTFAAQIDGGLTTSRRNVIIGADSGQYITTGDQNTVVGNEAMKGSDGNGDQASNVAIGYYSLRVNEADNNTAVGSQAGQNTTTGDSNVFVGQGAGSVIPPVKVIHILEHLLEVK